MAPDNSRTPKHRTTRHFSHELAWAPSGSATLTVSGVQFRIDGRNALWIPAGLTHTIQRHERAVVLPLFFPGALQVPVTHAATITRDAELDELMARLAHPKLLQPWAAVEVRSTILASLQNRVAERAQLRMPRDPRAFAVASSILADPARSETLEQWGRRVHASAKTLQRCFAKETGMGFPQWRRQARLIEACTRLEQGRRVQEIASEVGYASATSFITAFRSSIGQTPAAYRQRVLRRITIEP